MTLTLTIEGAGSLENGQPARFELDRHGAVIGRSPHADWSLPDPRNFISSRHCEISYREGQYLLTDHSTNGTYLNEKPDRLRGAHVLADGDRFSVGHYAITAHQAGAVAQPAPAKHDASGWEAFPALSPARVPSDKGRWADPVGPIAEAGARWRRSDPAAPADVRAGTWDLPAPVARPSAWSSAPSAASAPTANDVWGRLSHENEIDWSRGNFGAVAPSAGEWGAVVRPAVAPATEGDEARPDQSGLEQLVLDDQAPARPQPGRQPDRPVETQGTSAAPDASAAAGDAWARFVAVSGLPADRLNRPPADVIVTAGALLRQLVGGLMLMIEARARAKAQLGVQATGLELDGNNPLKFVRSPERAMLQLLDATERGFMPAERAVEDAYQDLQAHQMATLSAMRGALKGTLARFAPEAFRNRAAPPKGIARWFPVLHRARQWDAYVRDFEGVVQGADETFMDEYAKEFRLHYDRHIGGMKQRRRQDQTD